jgi:hypothetical protein
MKTEVALLLSLATSSCGVGLDTMFNLNASGAHLSNVVQLGETGYTTHGSVPVIDASGNIYASAYTAGNLVSCNGVSTNCSGAAQGARDYAVSKYNSSGAWLWTVQLGETGQMSTGGAGVDPSGNVYIAGYTTGNLVSCNGVSANCSGTARGTDDYFITKYNSSGAWQWTIQLGETGKITYANAPVFDSSGNIYLSGSTKGNLASCNGVSANCSGSAHGSYDYFISKYNPSGVWQWTAQLGEVGSTLSAQAISSDASGNTYVSGSTNGNLVSCNGVSTNCSGSSQGSTDYFVSKYNSSGNWVWTVQLGETSQSTSGYVSNDNNGNVYIGGSTTGNLASCGGVSASCAGSAQSGGTNTDYFVSKYNASGIWQWTTQIGESGTNTQSFGTAADSSGNVFVGGITTGNLVSCHGISANCSGPSQAGGANDDFFITKYNSSGVWQWTSQLGETGQSSVGYGPSTDLEGNVYMGGFTSGNLVTCLGVATQCSGNSQGIADYFVAQYNSAGVFQ